MSSNIVNLPPPWPNAAIALSRLAGNVQLQERIDRSAEKVAIKTGFPDPAEQVDSTNAVESNVAAGDGSKGVDVSV